MRAPGWQSAQIAEAEVTSPAHYRLLFRYRKYPAASSSACAAGTSGSGFEVVRILAMREHSMIHLNASSMTVKAPYHMFHMANNGQRGNP